MIIMKMLLLFHGDCVLIYGFGDFGFDFVDEDEDGEQQQQQIPASNSRFRRAAADSGEQ